MFPLTQNEEVACYWFGRVKIVVIHGDFRNERTDAILSEVDFMGAGKVVAACNDSVKAEINDWKQSKDILFTVGGGDLQSEKWDFSLNLSGAISCVVIQMLTS